MDNTAQDIAQDPAKPQGGKRLIYILVATLAILILLIVLVSRYLPQPKVKVAPQPKSAAHKVDYTANLEKAIKTTFTSSAHKDIIDYINLASQEKNLDKRYEYYQKAFAKMSLSYQKSKDVTQKLALYQLKDYMKVFPSYKEADTVIPK